MTVTADELIGRAAERAENQLQKGDSFKDLSTVIITPIRGDKTGETECDECGHTVTYPVPYGFAPIVVESWKRLIKPMNHPVVEIIAQGYEVGDAYQQCVENVLANPTLRNFRYILFLEDDVMIPHMPGTKGPLFRLYQLIEDGYDVANGLYWTKGEFQQPLIFGDPAKGPDNFECLTEGWEPGDVVECNGAGMGFSLWRMGLFKDKRFEKPWFKTLQEDGVGAMTQDLYAYQKIRRLGYRVCVDTGVKCGHYDATTGEIY